MRHRWVIGALVLAASSPALGQTAAELRDLASNFGLTPQQARQVFALYDVQAMKLAALADSNKIDRRLLRSAALRLGAKSPNISADEFLSLVEGQARQAGEAQAKIIHLESLIGQLQQKDLRAEAQANLLQARKAFDEGRLEDAERAFAGLELLRRSDLSDARDAWKESIFAQMDVLALAGENEKASQLAQRAAAEVMDQARHDSWAFVIADGHQWLERGELFGDSAALDRAMRILQTQALQLAPADSAALDWARTQNEIGNVLLKLGERSGGIERFEQAVTAYRTALTKLSREKDGSDWSMVHHNLCGTLFQIGQRKEDTKTLEQAAFECRASLEATSKESEPDEWAGTQDLLGQILLRRGELEGSSDLFAQGMRARQEASEVAASASDQEPTPVELALGYLEDGDYLVGLAMYDKAVESYHLALKDIPREQFPMEWARAQNGLGNALKKTDSDGIAGDAYVSKEEALAAYRLALEEFRRDRVPLYWALVQRNLADTLWDLSIDYRIHERNDDLARKRFEESVAAYRLAIAGYSEAGAKAERTYMQVRLGCELVSFAKSEDGIVHLDEAIATLEPAIAELGPPGPPRKDGRIDRGAEARGCLVEAQSNRERRIPSNAKIGEEGYIYYGRTDAGVPNERGQLRRIDGQLPSVSELRAGDRFKSLSEKLLRAGPTDRSDLLRKFPSGMCFLALEVMDPWHYDGGESVWMNVRAIDCESPAH